MTKKGRNMMANCRRFKRMGLVGGFAFALMGAIDSTKLWAAPNFSVYDAGQTETNGLFTWKVRLHGGSTGDRVYVVADLFDNNGNEVDPPYPMPVNNGQPVIVPPNGDVMVSITWDAENARSNLPCTGQAYFSGQVLDRTLRDPWPITSVPKAARPAAKSGKPPAAASKSALGTSKTEKAAAPPVAATTASATTSATAAPPGGLPLDFGIECKCAKKMNGFAHAWQIPVLLSTNQPVRMRVIYQAFYIAPNGATGGLVVSPRRNKFQLTAPTDVDIPAVDATGAVGVDAKVIFVALAIVKLPGQPAQFESARTTIYDP
ncbi:MAG TPA: hypothetical protein VMR25_20080 [Planctomycetaceae bacterium]|jgi:hypothetical protein|nr:hypothetical protein [Planctomycetaceae bacterium]